MREYDAQDCSPAAQNRYPDDYSAICWPCILKKMEPNTEIDALDYLNITDDFTSPDTVSTIDESSLWSARFARLLLDELELQRDIRGLDLGCGAGFPLFELAHLHGPTCRFLGIDPWKEAIARAAMKRRVYGLKNVTLIIADAASLPLCANSLDLIVSNLGLNNFHDAPRALAECARVARPGARLALTTNLTGHWTEFYDVFRDSLLANGLNDAIPALDANIAHRGTTESLAGQCEHAGFEVERTVKDRFDLRYLDGSAMLRHQLTRFGFIDSWRKIIGPAHEKPVFADLERRLNERARRENGLRLTVPMLYLEARRV